MGTFTCKGIMKFEHFLKFHVTLVTSRADVPPIFFKRTVFCILIQHFKQCRRSSLAEGGGGGGAYS
jgi:hypothetical protein